MNQDATWSQAFTKHKFKHSFQDNLNPFCDCGYEIETTAHFPLHWFQFYTERNTLLNKIKSIDTSILNQNNSNFSKTVVFGDPLNCATIDTLTILLQMLLLTLFQIPEDSMCLYFSMCRHVYFEVCYFVKLLAMHLLLLLFFSPPRYHKYNVSTW